MSVIYFVVVPFDRNADGDLAAGAAKEAISAGAAERGAGELALRHAGAVAFSRTGDPLTGEFEDAVSSGRPAKTPPAGLERVQP
jgi:hypothetical protein